MKKIIVFIVVLLLILAVSGCDFSIQNSDGEPTPTATASSTNENKKITEEQAIEIASQYWGVKSGDIDEETGFPFIVMPVESSNDNFKIALKWLVDNHHYSTVDMIEIDAFTGEILNGDIG